MAGHTLNLLCLSGRLRPVSYTLAACRAVGEIAQERGIAVEIPDPSELNLPMYVPDWDYSDYGPQEDRLRRLIAAYRRADALIWASPTYHGTVTGVFKNALDFAEFLSTDSPAYFQGKPVGLISINDSTTFAAMRDCARELRAWLAPTQVELDASDFDGDLALTSERGKKRLARLVDELASFGKPE